jgi:pimeloyl-ACP methyl ester carboxylesterase
MLHLCRAAPDVAVVVVGFAGHSLTADNGGAVFVLQQQIEAADDFFRRVVFGGRGGQCRIPHVMVGGHSIGSYVALHMSARFPRIRRCFFLAPTIMNMAKSPNGQKNRLGLLAPVISSVLYTAITGVAMPLVARLHRHVRNRIVAVAQPFMSATHCALVSTMAVPRIVRNVLTLARSEFVQVAELDVALLRSVEDRLVMYFVHGDGWVPLTDMATIQTYVRDATVVLEHDRSVRHAWCCDSAAIVADMVAKHSKGDLGE